MIIEIKHKDVNKLISNKLNSLKYIIIVNIVQLCKNV